ncbi:MAG TPA: ABC transporter permease subunit, partial [Pyrodictium sp.]|nr:ABC transporter permease subunit [Pyrodictium sp.]
TYGELALSLGASERQAMLLALRESLPGILASTIMGFSRAIGELGVALIVGGNIRGYTRVLTTAIALEVSKGEFEKAVALGTILVSIATTISIVLKVLKRLSTQ